MKALMIKELRSYLRAARPFTILTLYLVVLSVPMLLFYSGMRNNQFGPGDFSEIGQMIFVVVNGIALAQLTLLTPSNAAGAIGGERERQTLDLLLVTPLASLTIVLAKLAAPVFYLLLLALATLPISSLAFFIGGITAPDLLVAFLIMVGSAIGYGAVGIAASIFTRSSRGATVLALGITIFLAVGMPLLLMLTEEMIFDRGPNNGGLFEGALLPFSLALLALSPFASFLAVMSETDRSDGSIWTMRNPGNGGPGNGNETVPALWLIGLVLWLVLTLLLLLISARRLRRSTTEV